MGCLLRGFLFTLYPVTSPGSQTAAETSFTSKSCTSPMLSPTFSKPSWRTLREGTSTFTSKPRTLPKFRRNCTTMRQSENVLPPRTRPGMRGSSGRGWKAKKRNERFRRVFQKNVLMTPAGETCRCFHGTYSMAMLEGKGCREADPPSHPVHLNLKHNYLFTCYMRQEINKYLLARRCSQALFWAKILREVV